MDTIIVKVLSPFGVGGTIARRDELVEVSVSEAKDLLNRGKAELAIEADAALLAPRSGPLSLGPTADDDEPPAAPTRKGKRGG